MTEQTDSFDRRLRARGAAWRAGLPEPRAVVPASYARRTTDRWTLVAVAATVVGLLIGVAWLLGPGIGSEPRPLQNPTSDTTLSDATSAAPASPVCGPGDLKAGRVQRDGAGGTLIFTVRLSLAGTTSCQLEGYPEVVLLDHGEDAGVEVVHDDFFGRPEPVTVAAGRPAQVTLAWALSHYCGDVDNDTTVLRLGDRARFEIRGFGRTSCDGGEGQPAVRVQPVRAVAVEPATQPEDQRCRTGDLQLADTRMEPAAGTVYITAEFRLTGPDPCEVEGYPDVLLLDHGDKSGVAVEDSSGDGSTRTVVVRTDQPASVTISWTPGHYCGEPVDNDTIAMHVADDDFVVDGFGQTACNGQEGTPSALLRPFTTAGE